MNSVALLFGINYLVRLAATYALYGDSMNIKENLVSRLFYLISQKALCPGI